MDRLDPQQFKHALGRFASGVTVISAVQGDRVAGMTASAFISVSLDPPLVLVSVDKGANMHSLIAEVRRFGVSILREGQEAHSNHFAGRPQPDNAIEWHRDGFDSPVLADALAALDCDLHEAISAGDHTLYVGLVKHLRYVDGRPLLYSQGRYGALK